MLNVCAWCEQEGQVDAVALVKSAAFGEPITHGICEEHLKSILAEQGVYSEGARRFGRVCA